MKITYAAAALLSTFLATGAGAATLVNGSLTGQIGAAIVPAGWTSSSGSPDTNNELFTIGGGYAVTPDASPDGGTWVGFGRTAGSTEERFGQTISDFSIGQAYELSWSAGLFGLIVDPSYSSSNTIEVLLDGVQIGTGSLMSLGSAWVADGFEFTATATSGFLSFGLVSDVDSYLQIDGISLTEVVDAPAVPLPAGLVLLGTGLMGFGALRRRK